MSSAHAKFDLQNRGLFERLFEPPAVGKMAPVAKIVVYSFLAIWSLFVLFPIYWVIITSFKDAAAVNQGRAIFRLWISADAGCLADQFHR